DLYQLTSVEYENGHDVQKPPFTPGDASSLPMWNFERRVQSQTFAYDPLGNMTEMHSDDDARGGIMNGRSLGTVKHRTGGIGPNQLATATGPNNSSWAYAGYDETGNTTSIVRSIDSSKVTEQLSQLAYEWDEIGQLTRARRWDFPDNRAPAAELKYA